MSFSFLSPSKKSKPVKQPEPEQPTLLSSSVLPMEQATDSDFATSDSSSQSDRSIPSSCSVSSEDVVLELATEPPATEQLTSTAALTAMMVTGEVFVQYVYRGPIAQKRRVLLYYQEKTAENPCGSLHWCGEFADRVCNPKDCMPLHSVTDLIVGKKTKILQSSAAAAAVETNCFSLVSKSLVLDLEALNPSSRSTWVKTIMIMRQHIEESQSEDNVSLSSAEAAEAEAEAVSNNSTITNSIAAAAAMVTDQPVSVSHSSSAMTSLSAAAAAAANDAFTDAAAAMPGTQAQLHAQMDQQGVTENSSGKLSLVNFLATKQARVLELESKIDLLTAKLSTNGSSVASAAAARLSALSSSSSSSSSSSKRAKTRRHFHSSASAASATATAAIDTAALREEVGEALSAMEEDILQTVASITEATAQQQEHISNLSESLAKEKAKRRQLLNKMIEMAGNIRVFCRVRPLNAREKKLNDNSVITLDEDEDSLLLSPPSAPVTDSSSSSSSNNTAMPKQFTFDRVFGMHSTQAEVFADVEPLVDSAVDGFTVCIFAYGQTGSGKTFTMEGGAEEASRGVNYQAMDHMFAAVARERKVCPDLVYSIDVSVVEVYNEEVRDLLNSNGATKVDVREGGSGIYIPGLTEMKVYSTQQVRSLMTDKAYPNRSVRGTSMNEHSSRSHCLLFVNIASTNCKTGVRKMGRLVLIDLAGSERIKKSEATGQGLKEAQAINKSLSALGNVISALQGKSGSHIPYRDSKLTFLLQSCLGGNCKCLMFCNVSPATSNHQESQCSLSFASRVRATKLGVAKRNGNTADSMSQSRAQQSKEDSKSAQKEQKKLSEQLAASKKALAVKTSSARELEAVVLKQEKELSFLKETQHNLNEQLKKQQQQFQEQKVLLQQQLATAKAAAASSDKRAHAAERDRDRVVTHAAAAATTSAAAVIPSTRSAARRTAKENGNSSNISSGIPSASKKRKSGNASDLEKPAAASLGGKSANAPSKKARVSLAPVSGRGRETRASRLRNEKAAAERAAAAEKRPQRFVF